MKATSASFRSRRGGASLYSRQAAWPLASCPKLSLARFFLPGETAASDEASENHQGLLAHLPARAPPQLRGRRRSLGGGHGAQEGMEETSSRVWGPRGVAKLSPTPVNVPNSIFLVWLMGSCSPSLPHTHPGLPGPVTRPPRTCTLGSSPDPVLVVGAGPLPAQGLLHTQPPSGSAPALCPQGPSTVASILSPIACPFPSLSPPTTPK